MTTKTHFLAPTIFLLFAGHCSPTFAGLTLNFSGDNGASFSDSFDAQVGDALTIGVYIQQTAPDTILTDDGMVGWGFDLTRDNVALGSVSNAAANSVYDFENHNVTTSTGFEWEYGTTSTDPADFRDSQFHLGSFQFNPMGGGSTLFTVQDRKIGTGFANSSWLTPSASDFDEQLFGSGATGSFQFSVNVTAVPEPSSLVVISGVAGLCILRRRLRA
ncbi:MAG: PEP-CTERM sorting domain-containing protein [Planctomycetota bacterium]